MAAMSEKRRSQPLVSVIMATHDEPQEVLCAAIDSILGQTLADLELIVCSDNPGRSRMHRTVARRYAQDGRVRFLFNAQSIGLGFSLNRCLGVARGPVTARMDADDVSLPDRLAQQYAALMRSADRTIVFVGAEMEDADGRRFARRQVSEPSFEADFFPHDPFLHGTMMMRTDDYRRFGYHISTPPEDYDLYFRLFRAGYAFRLLDATLYRYRFAEKLRYRTRDALRRRAFNTARTQIALMNCNAVSLAGCRGALGSYARCLAFLAAAATPFSYRAGKTAYARLRPVFGR